MRDHALQDLTKRPVVLQEGMFKLLSAQSNAGCVPVKIVQAVVQHCVIQHNVKMCHCMKIPDGEI